MALSEKPKPTTADKNKAVARRWGAKTADAGWTAVPNVLLYNVDKLGLSGGELVTLLNILSHWREAGKYPYVAKSNLANRMGKDPRTIQTHLKNLCEPRMVGKKTVTLMAARTRHRGGRQLANEYRFEGLIEILTELAIDELARRKTK